MDLLSSTIVPKCSESQQVLSQGKCEKLETAVSSHVTFWTAAS